MSEARSIDDLDAARGIANGVLFGAVLWAFLIWAFVAFTPSAQACDGSAATPAPAPVIRVLVA